MIKHAALLALAASAICAQAHAQTAPRVVSPFRPDQNATSRPFVRGVAPSGSALPKPRDPDTPITPFSLQKVEITGSSLPASELEEAYADFAGQMIDNAKLEEITQAVSRVYGRHDIALYTVFVPQQAFAGGVLKLVAVEGFIQATNVKGKLPRRQKRLLSEYVARLELGRPLKTSVLQRYVSLIRDMPGLYPSLSLSPGTGQGAVRLEIDVKPKPVQAAFGISNRGTALLGETQAQADVFLNGLAVGGDQLRGTVVLPTDPTLFQYYALSYSAPLNADGTTAQVSAGYLRTRPRLLPLQGDAVTLGFQVSHPLIRRYNTTLTVTAGIDGVNANSALLGDTLSDDHVRTGRLAASYTTSNDRNTLTISGTLSHGLGIFGERVFDTGASRPDFTKFNVKLIDNVQVAKQVVLRLDGFAQLTGDRLPSSEQIALGGDEFGRAYEAAVIAGDSGIAGSAELAFIPAKLPSVLKGSEAYIFADGGRVWSADRFGEGGSRQDLGSIGGGVRAQVAARSVIQLEAARGLTNPVFYEDRQAWRLIVSFRTLF